MYLRLRNRSLRQDGGVQVAVKLRLKEIREAKGIKQAQLAALLNCSVAAYSRYESGTRQPSIETLGILADFFGVSTDYLYGRTPPDSSALSDYEVEMITKFRKAPKSVREDVVDFLELKTSKKEVLRK